MSYKDIVVFLDTTSDTKARFALAVSLAKKFSARLIGVDVSIASAFDSSHHHQTVSLRDIYAAEADMHEVGFDFRVAGSAATAGWQDLYCHFADLVIAPERTKENNHLVHQAVPDQVLISSGVPILILPPEWKNQVLGRSIVIAWTPSREATRAIHDAMPFLQQADRVTLFEYGPPGNSTESAPEMMAAHLLRHGVKVEVYAFPAMDDASPVDALFACLDRQEADLIVAGAYGHSRLLEGLFGGASQDLLHNLVMPVLMSH